jgi:hypothetical protein
MSGRLIWPGQSSQDDRAVNPCENDEALLPFRLRPIHDFSIGLTHLNCPLF